MTLLAYFYTCMGFRSSSYDMRYMYYMTYMYDMTYMYVPVPGTRCSF